MTDGYVHVPVLLQESIAALLLRAGGRYVDATLGGGGHAEKMLELSEPNGTLLGIDADPVALAAARSRLARFGDRVTLVESYFDDLAPHATQYGFLESDGVLFDLGVSSPQLDQPERGFSFSADAPLDMRFGPSADRTAADLVNELPSEELQRIFSEYGEERFARRIAQRIVEERRKQAIRTTSRLAAIVARAKPGGRGERIHPATRVFQALRIEVNDELGRLRRALPEAVEILRAGGRLAVISFHSLEDRIVKQFMRDAQRGCVCPPSQPLCTCGRQPTLTVIARKPITASADEIHANPRARSAKLRIAERLPAQTTHISEERG